MLKLLKASIFLTLLLSHSLSLTTNEHAMVSGNNDVDLLDDSIVQNPPSCNGLKYQTAVMYGGTDFNRVNPVIITSSSGQKNAYVKCSIWEDCPPACLGNTWRKCPTTKDAQPQGFIHPSIKWNGVNVEKSDNVNYCVCSTSQGGLKDVRFIVTYKNAFEGLTSC